LPNLPETFSVKKAHHAQICISQKLILKDILPTKIRTVAGVDVGYVGEVAVGAVAILEYDSLELIESCVAVCKVKMPYVHMLLSFREIPPAMAAIERLRIHPDVLLVDAQGYAHPYRCGFASHLGLALKKPTIGVAKSRLIGTPTDIEGRIKLLDAGEAVGEVVTTKKGVKPVYVTLDT
jgi:deoxyribonuclease V